MPASGAQEEKKMPKGHHWKNTRARDPLGWGGAVCSYPRGTGVLQASGQSTVY